MTRDRTARFRAALHHAIEVAAEDDVPGGTLLNEVVILAASVAAHLPVDVRLVGAVLQAQAENARRHAGMNAWRSVTLAHWLTPPDEL